MTQLQFTPLGNNFHQSSKISTFNNFLIYSIENFKRPQTEVDALLKLAKEKFQKLVAEKDRLEEHGVKVNVLGNLNLLPEDLQELVHKAMDMTKTHSK